VNTQLSYETAWRLRVSPRFGRVLVRRIRSTQIEDWLAELTHEGMSASKVIEAHGVHKRVLDRAVRDGAIALNPCARRGLPLPRPPQASRSGGGVSAVAWWLLLVSGVALAVVDWREHRLPTPLVAVAGIGIACVPRRCST